MTATTDTLTSPLNVRINSSDKQEFTKMCEKVGLTVSGAINLLVKRCINSRSIAGIYCDEFDLDANGFTKEEREKTIKSLREYEQGLAREHELIEDY